MDEQPKLRKRSEARQATFPTGESTPPATIEGGMKMAPREMEDISAFVIGVKKAGFEVSLIVAAGWGTEKRDEVRKWMTTRNPATIPACLAACLAALGGRAPTVPDRAVEEAKEGFRRKLMAVGVHPLLADVMLWTPVQIDVTVAWLEQGAEMKSIPEWLDRYVVKDPPGPRVAKATPQVPALPGMAPLGMSWQPKREEAPISKEQVEHASAAVESADRVLEVTRKADLPDAWKPQDEKPLTGVKKHEPPKALPPVSESDDYNRLIETVLKEIDLDSEYDDLEKLLEVGDNRRDYATVYEALDRAERRALRAHGVWAQARLEHERLKLDQAEVNANLWKQAMEELEKEGGKTRIADVDAKIAEMFPDEWRGGKMRLKRSELAVERCEKFSELWAQKVRSLNTMLGSVRK